jgi:GNAT superfamily N-acetyltransferase
MASLEHLGPQFHDAPNGKRYRIEEEPGSWRAVTATVEGNKHPIGYLNHFDINIGGGEEPDKPTVFKTFVKPFHRRQGVASAMFDYAERQNGERGLQHSGALTDDGKAFKEGHLRKKGMV